MTELKFLDLKAGQELPRGKVRSVQLMTNGSVRVYYEAPTEDVAFEMNARIAGEAQNIVASPLTGAQGSLANGGVTGDGLAEKKRLESDMASGKGSKRGK